MQGTPIIREARPEDADAAIEVVRSSIEELCVADHQHDPDTLARWLSNKTPQSFRGWVSNPENFCVVAEGDRGLSGVGLLRREGELVLFFLAPGTQRQGVGTLIYRALEKKAFQWGLSRLHLGSTFMARSFYEKLGFRSIGPAQTVFGVLLSYPYEKILMEHDRARAFAITAHGDQKYGNRPYAYHLDAVAELAAPYGDEAVVVAYLHDIVEDTPVTLQDIEAAFGPRVAECVSLLTDQPGASRKERKAKTYAKLATVEGESELALIVKTADRLANVRACVADRRRGLWEVYRSEHPVFRKAAYRGGQCEPLWSELDELLSAGWHPR